MASPNRLRETLLIILIIVIILLGLSFTDSSFSIGGFKLRRVDILADVKLRAVYLKVPLSARIINDSIIRSAIRTDSLIVVKHKKTSGVILDFNNDTIPALEYFFESLSKTQQKQKKTRIGYFGDSMIEGDLVTQDLRSSFQDTFGGIGVGFMPVTSIVAGFRQTIFHTFSGNWQTYTLLDPATGNDKLGITGFGFIPSINSDIDPNESWVKYSAVPKKNLNKFYNVSLFYGVGSGTNNVVNVAGRTFPLNGTSAVNEVCLNKGVPVQSINAGFRCKKPVNIYGFSLEGDSGVYVDNFSFRGNSGMPLTKISSDVLSGLNNHLDYGLIILHYGVNVVNYKVTDFSWYEKGMIEVVKHLKTAMPNASILIISTGDKSFKQDGKYVTDPSVPLVIEVQKRVAEKTGVAFWNLYEAMGGYNSMVKWVEGDTVLACRDYTHPNFKGAKKIADMLYKQLMAEYKEYVRRNS